MNFLGLPLSGQKTTMLTRSMDKMVAVFVDKSLESVLRGVGAHSRRLFKLYSPAIEDTLMAQENADK
ncbi:hypothetical protein T4A_496 [Trichinella pseudospiralis]|uniref:Uncharacterized protein n=1 Tax=Trichinella pseudospiralis TaxID=6337 RepID=A0A0V1DRI3_TRIPS|nr:hypothetical protein T4A_496 [Trichinella pseudospiralis]